MNTTARLGPRARQIVELLLQGCGNKEIARRLKMAQRTVKAHLNRLFLRFGITDGLKRVKLATLLYRSQLGLEQNADEQGGNTASSTVFTSPKPVRKERSKSAVRNRRLHPI